MTADRRTFLKQTLTTSLVMGLGPGVWRRAFAAQTVVGDSPYGPLGKPDANGVRLPAGFAARLVAMTGQVVRGTDYVWHGWPDGGACFPTPGGGWVYVSNSELDGTAGGASAIRFSASGEITAAYRILSGTRRNCAGGPTPWGAWLSCEEYGKGLVWECDPFAPGQGISRPALGAFAHEAAAVDPATGIVYLTEDAKDGRFYRFKPRRHGDLSAGMLEAARVDASGQVSWASVSPERPYRGDDTTVFIRGEGAWFASGHVYFTTTADNKVWDLDTAADRLETIYDAALLGPDAPLHEPDNVTVHARSGDIYVAEDEDDLQIVLLANAAGQRIAAPLLQLAGHGGSEITGPAFSPDGMRLYFSSQRGTGGAINGRGMTFEVTGPFRVCC
jgi:secreted PhoX family phosphatase